LRVVLIALALSLPACRFSGDGHTAASVTVKLPPPRPYVPGPAFSFGAAPRTAH
jgi:hypothetical protein